MYIITLGLLAPYREMGLGSALLTRSLQEVHQLPEITKVVLHVQQGNDRAVKFYQKFGFKVVDVIENYYMKIQPRSAVLLELGLPAEEHVRDLCAVHSCVRIEYMMLYCMYTVCLWIHENMCVCSAFMVTVYDMMPHNQANTQKHVHAIIMRY